MKFIPFFIYVILIKKYIIFKDHIKNVIIGIVSFSLSVVIHFFINKNSSFLTVCTYFVITYYYCINFIDDIYTTKNNIFLRFLYYESKNKIECNVCLDEKNILIFYTSNLKSTCEQCSCKLCSDCFNVLINCPICKKKFYKF